MLARCYYPRTNGYKYYGGKGVRVCREWRESFVPFYEWAMANGYMPLLSIGRKDHKKGYAPGNCQWETPLEQRGGVERSKQEHANRFGNKAA